MHTRFNIPCMSNNNRKKGVSGLMRVRNERRFIEPCVKSCIDALDELIIVYNDCTDGSEEVIEKVRQQYPQKIKVFHYPYKVLGAGLNKEEYECVKKLPLDSPHLLCNYYNFALSKATYMYAIKIDADQMYFAEVLKEYGDLCRSENFHISFFQALLGKGLQLYLSCFRFLSMKLKHSLPLMPDWLASYGANCYIAYAQEQFLKGKACLSFSGLNVFKENDQTYVCLGLRSKLLNVLPPFNGEGDHVLFRISDKTYYLPYDMDYYNTQRSFSYSVIEQFIHPFRIMPVGFAWLHLSAERDNIRDKVSLIKRDNPDSFIKLQDFTKLSYKNILKKSDKVMFSLFQRVLFSFVYKAYRKRLNNDIFGK